MVSHMKLAHMGHSEFMSLSHVQGVTLRSQKRSLLYQIAKSLALHWRRVWKYLISCVQVRKWGPPDEQLTKLELRWGRGLTRDISPNELSLIIWHEPGHCNSGVKITFTSISNLIVRHSEEVYLQNMAESRTILLWNLANSELVGGNNLWH